MSSLHRAFWIVLTLLIALGSVALVSTFITPVVARPSDRPSAPGDIIVVSWNDLGMHCYNRDFNDLAVLPPANTLWAQVVQEWQSTASHHHRRHGGILLRRQHQLHQQVQLLEHQSLQTASRTRRNCLGCLRRCPPTWVWPAKGLSGTMDAQSDHFEAKWIPLTEYQRQQSHCARSLSAGDGDRAGCQHARRTGAHHASSRPSPPRCTATTATTTTAPATKASRRPRWSRTS